MASSDKQQQTTTRLFRIRRRGIQSRERQHHTWFSILSIICPCASTKTAIKLATAGFRVKELIGGLDWWKRDGYPTEGHAAGQGHAHQVHHAACGCAG